MIRSFLRVSENRSAIALGLALASAILGIIGWGRQVFFGPPMAADIGTIQKIGLVLSRSAQSFTINPQVFADGDTLTRLAALLGLLAVLTGAVLVAMATLGEATARFITRFLRRQHSVIVGEGALASRLAGQDGLGHTVSIRQEGSTAPGQHQALLVGYEPQRMIAASGLRRAKRLIIDAGDDAETIAIAKPLLARLSQKPHALQTIALRVRDPLIADVFADLALAKTNAHPLPRPLLFDENLSLARKALNERPLFALAQQRRQRRVHALIIGFGDLGQKLMDQIMLTSLAGTLDIPRISILDRDAARREAEMRARRPDVLNKLPIAFFAADVGTHPFEAESGSSIAALLAAEAEDALTAIYVCLPTAGETMRAVMMLRRFQEREGKLVAPVFYRSRREDADTEAINEPCAETAPERGAIPLVLSTDAIIADIEDPDKAQHMARHLHSIYTAKTKPDDDRNAPWPMLKETYRRANMRAADHLPAKLFTLGIDPRAATDKALLTPAVRQKLAALMHAPADDPVLEQLASLEHRRWMIERKLDGWRFGTMRDNKRRIHDLLIPWEELDGPLRAERIKDADQIVAIISQLLQR
jgi:hypothetical protein